MQFKDGLESGGSSATWLGSRVAVSKKIKITASVRLSVTTTHRKTNKCLAYVIKKIIKTAKFFSI